MASGTSRKAAISSKASFNWKGASNASPVWYRFELLALVGAGPKLTQAADFY